MLKVFIINNVLSDGTYKLSLLHYQMTTNSAVKRNPACVINNCNNSLIKVRYNFCMINELLIWIKIKIISMTIVLILLGDRFLRSKSFNCFWILFLDSTACTVIEFSPIFLSYKNVLWDYIPCRTWDFIVMLTWGKRRPCIKNWHDSDKLCKDLLIR